ncbi:rhodanese-like domain-containing protein [Pseudomonas baltica]|uniref:rhodanese-like domain-containing protein n=1 Tax=Pseudomonas baltica TaxID=2762576 RepID=UPI00289669C9|nr:rhodanese-like domain-containing protein [Pseudomonas baltica]
MTSPTPLISTTNLADRVRAASQGQGEIAVIDVREQHAYAEQLILLSTNLPLQRLELSVATALPRLQTPIVIVDHHGELAEQAVQRLRQLGYSDLSILDGGIQGWQAAGLTLYDGFNVRSKAFAERIEHDFGTPAICATELFARQSRGEDILVLDSRPYEEYHHSTVPGALSVPGAELIRNVRDIAPNPRTTLVVSCGGRTRSIVGAQALISAGVPNPVFSLRNGTGGLRLDGIDLQYGAIGAHAQPSTDALAWAEHAARQWEGQTPTTLLSAELLQRWQADPQRTLYVLDLREAPSYAAGHHPLARNVSGGQVLQAIDVHAPVWNARIVLIDDASLVRARQTAFWLAQLGSFEVGIIAHNELPEAHVQGAPPAAVRQARQAQIIVLEAAQLASALQADNERARPTVIDLSLSPAYRKAHIPGSQWALRSQLPELLESFSADQPLVLTCEDGRLSRVAAEYLVAESPERVSRLFALAGGNLAWQAAGLPTMASQINGPADVAHFVDVWTPPQQTIGDMLGAVKKYLNWEVDLLDQLARDPLNDVIIRGLLVPSRAGA